MTKIRKFLLLLGRCLEILRNVKIQTEFFSITGWSLRLSHSAMSNYLWPHELQHARPSCTSPNPRAYSNSCLSNRWCHPTISSSVTPLSSCLQFFPSIRVFSNESILRIRWPTYWSFIFSIISSNEYSGLISFRFDWLDLLAVQVILKSLLQYHSSKALILHCSAFFVSNSHIHTWLPEKPQPWLDRPL